jgi:hypothetical protein
MGEELCQKPAERQGCALDQEARQELLRLQEPCERGCRAQTDPSLRGDRRERAGQPEIRWASEQGQHVCGRIRGQRVSLGRDRGEAQGARSAQSRAASIRYQRRRRTRTTRRARFGLASSTCSVLSKPHRAVGLYGRSASCGTQKADTQPRQINSENGCPSQRRSSQRQNRHCSRCPLRVIELAGPPRDN